MYKITYNDRENILTLCLGNNKSVDSDIRGNVVLDFDDSGRLVKLDIMDVNLEQFMSLADQVKEVRPKST